MALTPHLPERLRGRVRRAQHTVPYVLQPFANMHVDTSVIYAATETRRAWRSPSCTLRAKIGREGWSERRRMHAQSKQNWIEVELDRAIPEDARG